MEEATQKTEEQSQKREKYGVNREGYITQAGRDRWKRIIELGECGVSGYPVCGDS